MQSVLSLLWALPECKLHCSLNAPPYPNRSTRGRALYCEGRRHRFLHRQVAPIVVAVNVELDAIAIQIGEIQRVCLPVLDRSRVGMTL